MDERKIGSLIARERKDKNLTQAELAEKLHVSEKTVSKWENGRGLPDTGLLLNLCSIFGISVNELLSGERLSATEYREKAENNMSNLLVQRKSNRDKILFSAVCCFLTISVMLVCALLAGFLAMPLWLRICLLVYGFLIAVFGIGTAIFYDRKAGSFICKYCGKKFVPSAKAYFISYHTFTARRLKCPFCGKTGMCKKSLEDKDEG